VSTHYYYAPTHVRHSRAGKPSGYDEANDTTGTERIDRLYKDSEDKARKVGEVMLGVRVSTCCD